MKVRWFMFWDSKIRVEVGHFFDTPFCSYVLLEGVDQIGEVVFGVAKGFPFNDRWEFGGYNLCFLVRIGNCLDLGVQRE